MTWDNHRWIRYHSSVSLLEQFMGEFAETLEHPEPGDTTIMSLIFGHSTSREVFRRVPSGRL